MKNMYYLVAFMSVCAGSHNVWASRGGEVYESLSQGGGSPKQSTVTSDEQWRVNYLKTFQDDRLYFIMPLNHLSPKKEMMKSEGELCLRPEAKPAYRIEKKNLGLRSKIFYFFEHYLFADQPLPEESKRLWSQDTSQLLWNIEIDVDQGLMRIKSAHFGYDGLYLSHMREPKRWSWKKMRWKDGKWLSDVQLVAPTGHHCMLWRPVRAGNGIVYLENVASGWFLAIGQFTGCFVSRDQKSMFKFVPAQDLPQTQTTDQSSQDVSGSSDEQLLVQE